MSEETVEIPVSIDEVMGNRSIVITTPMKWTYVSSVKNTGFIPSSELLEEIQRKFKECLDGSIEDYDTGEIGTAKILPEDQEVVSVEVDIE